MKPKIYSDSSFATDLSQIKAIEKDYNSKSIIFYFKTRVEFRINPETELEEKIEISEPPIFTQPYDNNDQMIAYFEEWRDEWKKYIIENS